MPGGIVVRPGDGVPVRSMAGGDILLRILGQESDGLVTVYESRRETGDLTGPHLHRHDYVEIFYVLEGEFTFQLGDEQIDVLAGTCLFVPGGEAHTFRHIGEGVGRLLTVCIPGGLDRLFRESDPARREQIRRELGSEVLGPPLHEASP